eukprot:TRINITY_DN6250_c0_g1_i1.p1 TRINITY_DN6250_c0_g1~~TRINITY_DN6250_c0_g1_i1.p1  ORF type:complete len:284 (-),score=87.04 TRINITY_DN6250_c0_g1_i1:37-888(-)
MPAPNGKMKKWRKTLYEDNGYPDNYTPPEYFLAAIERNKNLRVYSLWECFSGAAGVGQELSVVIIFWCCYKFLKTDLLQPEVLLVTMLGLLVGGFLLFVSLVRKVNLLEVLTGLKTTFLFTVIGFALSPVLYKLTDTISTDTIHSMAMASFFLHLLTSDYGLSAPTVSWQISLNAAVFSSVCLASRFDHHLSAFSLLSLSVFCFLILPLSRTVLPSPLVSSLILGPVSLLLLSFISTPQLCLALLSLAAVQMVCPLMFHKLQADKQTIHGPWDEATPFAATGN